MSTEPPQRAFGTSIKSPLIFSLSGIAIGTAVYWLYEPDERLAKEAQALTLESESRARAQEYRERKRREALGAQSEEETKVRHNTGLHY